MTVSGRQKRLGLHLPVELSGQDAKGKPFAESTRSLNISGAGIAFESRQNLLVGSRLSLHIRLPDALRKHFGGKPVYRVRALVCSVEHFEGQPVFRVGARFLEELEA